jgi:hypothetical protein
MPFREYSSHFSPDELSAFATAYKAAWQHLQTTCITPDEAALVKKNLVQVILASACKGEREIERLKDVALKALGSAEKVSYALA